MDQKRWVQWVGIMALVLAATAHTQTPPKTGIAFWEVDPEPVDAVLRAVPKTDALRYATLHNGFQKFQCAGDRMDEQPAGKSGEKNLVCTLPGKNADRILVVARYDEHLGRAWPTWGNAVALMLLYHALQAQPREHTFVIAEIATEAGEKAFFGEERQHPPPVLTVVVDSFGMSAPRLVVIPPPKHAADVAKAQETQSLLQEQALKTKELMGISPPSLTQALTMEDAAGEGGWTHEILQSSLFGAARQSAAGVIFSQIGAALNPPAFHQDFDYLAWIVCGIDRKLDASTQAASQ
ncbi:MAG: hypothetical protein WA414_13005 [Acidobacteriaceae bacterium]|jgi:hypothetical protein